MSKRLARSFGMREKRLAISLGPSSRPHPFWWDREYFLSCRIKQRNTGFGEIKQVEIEDTARNQRIERSKIKKTRYLTEC